MIRSPVRSYQDSQVAAGRCSAGRDAAAQRGQVVGAAPAGLLQLRQHRAVGRGRGEQHGYAVLPHHLQQLSGPAPLVQQRGGSGPQGEEHQAAEPEGEAQRRGSGEHVLRARAQHPCGEGVGHGQHVPVEVRTALRASRGAGGEGDQRHVVGRRGHRLERVGLSGREPQHVGLTAAAEQPGAQPRYGSAFQFPGHARVAQRVADPRDTADGAQLVRALGRQDGDRDGPGLHHRQPAGGQLRGGGAAQQDAVAGDDAQLAGEHVRQPVDGGAQFAVRPGAPGGGAAGRVPRLRAGRGHAAGVEGGTVRAQPSDGTIQQLGTAVEARGVLERRIVQQEPWPLFGRGQVVAGEGVEVS